MRCSEFMGSRVNRKSLAKMLKAEYAVFLQCRHLYFRIKHQRNSLLSPRTTYSKGNIASLLCIVMCVYACACACVRACVCLSVCLPACLFVCLSACLSFCLYACTCMYNLYAAFKEYPRTNINQTSYNS